MYTQEREPDILDRLAVSISRHRHAVAPFAMALGTLTYSWVGHVTYPFLFVIGAVVALVLGLQGASELPTRHHERAVGMVAWAAICGWSAAAVLLGPFARGGVLVLDRPVLLYLLGVLTVVCGIPWYWHRRIRRGVEVSRSVAAWGDGGLVGLKGTKLTKVKADEGSFSATVSGVGTLVTYAQVALAKAKIAGLFHVNASAVQVQRGEHEGEAVINVRQVELEQAAWSPPLEPVSIRDVFSIGTFDDNTDIPLRLFTEDGSLDGAAIGVKGAGKSTYLNHLIARVAACYDAVVWIADLKPGAQEHKAWRPVADAFATTPAEVDEMYRALWRMLEVRGAQSGRKFQPSAEDPAIVLIVDECSMLNEVAQVPGAGKEAREAANATFKLLEARKAAIVRVMAVSRSLGAGSFWATQFGVMGSFLSTTIRSHLVAGLAVAFRTSKTRDASLVFNVGNVDTADHSLRGKPGKGFFATPEVHKPMLGRVHPLGDPVRDEVIARWTGQQPALPPALVAAGGDGYLALRRGQALQESVPAAPAAEQEQEQEQPAQPSTRQRLSPMESRQLVFDTLARFPEGATVAELAEASGRSATIIQSRLHELRVAGVVENRGRRRPVWRVVVGGSTGAGRS